MKDELPAPDANSQHYARPNQAWVCGWAAEGKCCRLGPSPKGECRVTFECQPVLEKKSGEKIGRWRCTRTADEGGACETGPLPNGACCRALPRCQPVRSLRARRGRFTLAVCALTVGVLLLLLCGPARLTFINPGPVSSHHTGKAFAEMAAAKAGLPAPRGASVVGEDSGCVVCHAAALGGPASWLQAAFRVHPGPLEVHRLAQVTSGQLTTIDQACLHCHARHDFHQPNALRDHSCSACHREHRSGTHMEKSTDANCLSCHGDAATMQASAVNGAALLAHDPHIFDRHPPRGQTVFQPPRPTTGKPQAFQSFSQGHPEFQLHAQALSDPNTLRFNHAKHLSSSTVPPINGKRLECNDCHQPDTAGAYFQRVSFAANCRTCHALQFDPANPQLQLPHGSTETVRAFLHSLPAQYADFGKRVKGLTRTNELAQFVGEQMQHWQQRQLAGEDVEQQIFTSTERWATTASVGGSPALGRAPFAGCAWCHEVKRDVRSAGASAYTVTPPQIPDRWFAAGRFDHAKHQNVSCAHCHDVARSQVTADISLPKKATCVECHSPTGGVTEACATCHSFHMRR